MSEKISSVPVEMTPPALTPGEPMDWKSTSTYILHPSAADPVKGTVDSSQNSNVTTQESEVSPPSPFTLDRLTDAYSARLPENHAPPGHQNLAVSSISNGLVHRSTGIVISRFSHDPFPLPASYLEIERGDQAIAALVTKRPSREITKTEQYQRDSFLVRFNRERRDREKQQKILKSRQLSAHLVMMPSIEQKPNNFVEKALNIGDSKALNTGNPKALVIGEPKALQAVNDRIKLMEETKRRLDAEKQVLQGDLSKMKTATEMMNPKVTKNDISAKNDKPKGAPVQAKQHDGCKKPKHTVLKPISEEDGNSAKSKRPSAKASGPRTKNKNDTSAASGSDTSHTMSDSSRRDDSPRPLDVVDAGHEAQVQEVVFDTILKVIPSHKLGQAYQVAVRPAHDDSRQDRQGAPKEAPAPAAEEAPATVLEEAPATDAEEAPGAAPDEALATAAKDTPAIASQSTPTTESQATPATDSESDPATASEATPATESAAAEAATEAAEKAAAEDSTKAAEEAAQKKASEVAAQKAAEKAAKKKAAAEAAREKAAAAAAKKAAAQKAAADAVKQAAQKKATTDEADEDAVTEEAAAQDADADAATEEAAADFAALDVALDAARTLAQAVAAAKMGEMIEATTPFDGRTKRAPDELIWQDLNRRAIDQPMLKAMSIELLPNLVTNVYDAMDEVLQVSGLAGNKGIKGLPLLMQDAMTFVPKIAEMARQSYDEQPLKIGAYALMSLAIALRSYAATFRVFESVGAVSGPPGTKPTSNELCLAVWHDKDGWKIQEGVFLAHDVWRLGYKHVEATYGSSTWKDGGAWIRRMAKGELDLDRFT